MRPTAGLWHYSFPSYGLSKINPLFRKLEKDIPKCFKVWRGLKWILSKFLTDSYRKYFQFPVQWDQLQVCGIIRFRAMASRRQTPFLKNLKKTLPSVSRYEEAWNQYIQSFKQTHRESIFNFQFNETNHRFVARFVSELRLLKDRPPLSAICLEKPRWVKNFKNRFLKIFPWDFFYFCTRHLPRGCTNGKT